MPTHFHFKNLKQLKTKTGKLFRLKKKQTPISQNTYEVRIINLSSYKDINLDGLKKGLNHSFVNKHKDIRRNLALELESFAEKAETFVPDEKKEAFHEYLRKITNTLSMNVEHAKDNTFKLLKELRENHKITILTDSKDSSVVILDKADYQSVVQKLIEEKVVVPENPLFYVRYVDDTYVRRKKKTIFFSML